MRILNFSYKEDSWELEDLNLQVVNLIVGQNGTGKTRTLFWLNVLKEYISIGDISDPIESGVFKISWLTKSGKTIKYHLEISENSIQELVISEESLFLEDKILLQRKNDGSCIIFSENKQEFDIFNPPANELALLSRRDTKDYPYFETVIDWAKNSYELQFSSINKANEKVHTGFNFENYPKLYSVLNKAHQKNVLLNFRSVGFQINDIEYHSMGNSFHHLILTEESLKTRIFQFDLSQGMMRSLCLLIYIEYLISQNKTATLLLDDLGEGLDYIRAKELGKILFKLCKDNNIQLIATSNDSFLMDVVDINYWNVLTRNGKVVTSINKQNHPDLFENFKFTGLSNFDFFSSDYIESHL